MWMKQLMAAQQGGVAGSVGDDADCPVTLIQEEWLTDFFGYTDDEVGGMSGAAAAAALEQEWAAFERTGQRRRAVASEGPQKPFWEQKLEWYRDPTTRPDELWNGTILYYVEVAADDVRAERHQAALREVADLCDTLRLPPIEMRWFVEIPDSVGEGEPAYEAWYRRTCAVFASHGAQRRPMVLARGEHPYEFSMLNGCMCEADPSFIFVRTSLADLPDLPYGPARLRKEASEYDRRLYAACREEELRIPRRLRPVPETVDGVEMVGDDTLAHIIRHEVAHCYQALTGIRDLFRMLFNDAEEMTDDEYKEYEMAKEAYERMTDEMAEACGWGVEHVEDVLRHLGNQLLEAYGWEQAQAADGCATTRPSLPAGSTGAN